MSEPCDVCGGRQFITLPIRQPINARTASAAAEAIGPNSRDYPCPECSPKSPIERVAVLRFHAMSTASYGDEIAISMGRRQIITMLAEHLAKSNFIRFRRGPPDPDHSAFSMADEFPMQGTIGVIAPANVATLQERVEQQQDETAAAVIDAASKDILNWGSYYSGSRGMIEKQQATAAMREAFEQIKHKRKQWRNA